MTEHQTDHTQTGGAMPDVADAERARRAEAKADAVRQRKDGKWFARPTLGVDPATGAQIRVSGVFPTKREALA